ncbi:MAG: class I SAM-dependent methyltransferase [Azoarcus sp.]|nr:class I SAM-dependent methyltransferase [Azoarcus sp.]
MLVLPLLALAFTQAAAQPPELDVVYAATPPDAVHRMLEIADVRADDRLVDLGSGDGRIVIEAARHWGVTDALGVELDPRRVFEARENAIREGVDDRVRFHQGDLFEVDFTDASVLTLYLQEELNLRLRPVILERMAPGTRVVSHVFAMGDWEPDESITARGLDVHLWVVPARIDGDWTIEMPDGERLQASFEQHHQKIAGSYMHEGAKIHMNFARLQGEQIRFSAAGMHFIGHIDGNSMTGVAGPGTEPRWHAVRR